MKIIRSKDELEGTCYIEVLPGKYNGKCWSDDSIFFSEEVFGFLEKSIEREYPEYDHYAFSEIHKETWLRILERLNILVSLLDDNATIEEFKDHVYFVFVSSEDEFKQDFDNNVHKLCVLIKEFQDWIRVQFQTQDYISVLGI